MNNFAYRLRELREANGWTQKQLGIKAGLSPKAVAMLEQGLRSPAWETLIAIANALDVHLNAFEKKAKDTTPRKMGRPPKTKSKPAKKQRKK